MTARDASTAIGRERTAALSGGLKPARRLAAAALFWLLTAAGFGWAQLPEGSQAPPFTLAARDGVEHRLAPSPGNVLHVLYFFDPDSAACSAGLHFLDQLAAASPSERVRIWAITRPPAAAAAQPVAGPDGAVPVLVDSAGVSERYQAGLVLPLTYLIGADLEIVAVLVGGGRSQELRLQRLLAERSGQPTGPGFGAQGGEGTAADLRRQGIEGFNRKDYLRAEAVLQQALALEADPLGYLYLAYCQMELGKKAELGLTLQRGVARFPEEVRLHRIYVRYLIDLGDRAGALRALDQALALRPEDLNLKMLKDYLQGSSPEQPGAGSGTP